MIIIEYVVSPFADAAELSARHEGLLDRLEAEEWEDAVDIADVEFAIAELARAIELSLEFDSELDETDSGG